MGVAGSPGQVPPRLRIIGMPETFTDRRERYRRNREMILAKYHVVMHGVPAEYREMLLDQQGGRCYLCLQPVSAEDAYLEHDHRCCPPKRSCGKCRRGMACKRCNYLIGLAGDSPALLRAIADRLEAVVAQVTERL